MTRKNKRTEGVTVERHVGGRGQVRGASYVRRDSRPEGVKYGAGIQNGVNASARERKNRAEEKARSGRVGTEGPAGTGALSCDDGEGAARLERSNSSTKVPWMLTRGNRGMQWRGSSVRYGLVRR